MKIRKHCCIVYCSYILSRLILFSDQWHVSLFLLSKICKHWLMVYWRYIVQMLVLFSKSIWFKLLQYQCFLLHLNDLETLILISWITETFQDKENEHFYHWQEFLLFHSDFSTIKAFLPCLYGLGTLILFSNYWNFSEKLLNILIILTIVSFLSFKLITHQSMVLLQLYSIDIVTLLKSLKLFRKQWYLD